MSEREQPDVVPDDPDIPDSYPDTDDAAPEVADRPLGTERGDRKSEEEGPLPGLLPESQEPPDAG